MTVLFQREGQVLEAAARGLTVRQTALALYLSEDTVKTYRKRVLRKYDARSMTEAVAAWLRER